MSFKVTVGKEPMIGADYFYGHTFGKCACADLMKRRKRRGKLVGAPKAYLDWLDIASRPLARALYAFFKQEAARIAEIVTAKKLAKADDYVDEIPDLDWSMLIGVFNDEIVRAYKKQVVEGFKMVGIDKSPDKMFELASQDAVEWAEERSAELVGMKYVDGELVENPDPKWSIAQTTRDDLRALIASYQEQAPSPNELRAAIEDMFSFSRERAMMVARTELSMAANQGHLSAWRATGQVVGKQSIIGNMHDVDDQCDEAADEGIIGIDELFLGEFEGPPYHPNCVCLSGDTKVWGPRPLAIMRRSYKGEVIILRTASGNELTVTLDHPILTLGGWVVAKKLKEGDCVVSCPIPDLTPLWYQDEKDGPSRVEDIAHAGFANRSISVAGNIVTAYLDDQFRAHNKKIGSVVSDPELPSQLKSFFAAQVEKSTFMLKTVMGFLHVLSALLHRFFSPPVSQPFRVVGRMCGLNLFGSLFWSQTGPLCSGTEAVLSASFRSSKPFVLPVVVNDSELIGEGVGSVLGPLMGHHNFSDSLARSVFLDELVSVRRVFFSDHVYNLQTVDGWYCANGIITHNCALLPILEGEEGED